MRRRTLVAIAAVLFSSAALYAPPPASAMSTCQEQSDSTCQTYCPGDLIAFCNYAFRFLHCDTQDAFCSNDGLCVNPPCCDVDTGEGCDWDPEHYPLPYCAKQHVICNFY